MADPHAENYFSWTPYNYVANNPLIFIDPDGNKLRVADNRSFTILLSTLPSGSRDMIKINGNGFIKRSSVRRAARNFSDSENLQALNTIVSDKRCVYLTETSRSNKFINTKNGIEDEFYFVTPTRGNNFRKLMDDYSGPTEMKEVYAASLKNNGIEDQLKVAGNFGATLRPKNEQKLYPGGQASTSEDFEIYINPEGTTILGQK